MVGATVKVLIVGVLTQALSVYCGGIPFRNRNQEEFVKRLSDFEVVIPELVSGNVTTWGSSPYNSSSDELDIAFTAFGGDFLLHVRKNTGFIAAGFASEVFPRVRGPASAHGRPGGCFYTGEVAGEEGSRVALSNCRGLIGFIRTKAEEFFIEPMMDLGKFYHLLYKRSSLLSANENSEKPGKCGTMKAPRALPDPPTPRLRLPRSVLTELTAQLLVVVDKEMIDFHGNESIEGYVLSVMNMVADLFRDPSAGIVLNIEVAKLMFLFETPKGLSIGHHGDRTLQSFCDWQAWLSRDTSSTNPRYDAAVLLTRKDICVDRSTPCATVGMAYIHGMCDPKRRCSVAEDDGLSVAFTVAHELGHNLGIHHDGEGNACTDFSGSVPNIMSPQWLRGTRNGTMKWSQCSRTYLRKVLSSGRSRCLRSNSRNSSVELIPTLQGLLFSADDQCRHTYGNRARQCIKYKSRLCRQLWCSVEGETLCRSKLIPAAKGTPCGPGKWCMYGHCVENGTIPIRQDGGWGEWSGWRSCSRTCGLGISIMTRPCDNPSPRNGGHHCTGEQKRFRTCNVKPCPKNAKDFRHVQCEAFNPTKYRGEMFQWKPVTSEVQPCTLFCQPKNSRRRFSAKLADKVIDGTPCRKHHNDVCIDGKCVLVGCDNEIGSNAEKDRCGVCKGNGTTCKVVEGRFNRLSGSGYVEVALIPKGATSILVKEVRPCASFLALRGDLGTYYINGNRKIELPGNYNADGTVVHYSRKGTWEKIVARGPTSAPLHIMVLYHGFNLGVKYHYSIPLNKTDGRKDAKGPNVRIQDSTSGWISMGWSPCSAHCDGGIRKKLKAACVRFSRGRLGVVADKHCEGATKPQPDERVCNAHKCRVWWAVSDWGPCSRTCGTGLQHRRVHCRRQLRNGSDTRAVSRTCPRDKPSGVRNCIERACYMQWITGQRSKCFAVCGAGYYFTVVRCPVPGKCSPSTKPPTRRPCQAQPCEQWKTGHWGKCSVRCGSGVHRRDVSCAHRLTGKASTGCPGPKPAETKPCERTRCAVFSRMVCRRDLLSRRACGRVRKYNLCRLAAAIRVCCETCAKPARLPI